MVFTEIGILAAGILPGWLLRGNARVVERVGQCLMGTIYALLFLLGLRLGADDALLRSLPVLGFQGLALGFFSTMGSAVCAMALHRLLRSSREAKKEAGRKETGQGDGFWQGKQGSLKIFGCFGAGIVLGITGLLPEWVHGGSLFLYILWGMLLCVGLCMGFDFKAFRLVGDMGPRVLLLPLLTILGAALGAALTSCFFADLDLRSCLAAGLGMGYYSLSTAIITEFTTPALASVTLIANVFRELFILLATPLLARAMGPLAPVAGAGAPGVDVCLPVIMRFSGEHYGFLAVFNGLVMTMLVPFTVPLVLTLGH